MEYVFLGGELPERFGGFVHESDDKRDWCFEIWEHYNRQNRDQSQMSVKRPQQRNQRILNNRKQPHKLRNENDFPFQKDKLEDFYDIVKAKGLE